MTSRAPRPDGASPLARFGARLRVHRVRSGWSQAELGRLVHVSGTLISKMERAERRPQPDVARRLDRGLGAQGELVELAAEALRVPDFGSDQFLGRRTGLDDEWQAPVAALRRLATAYDSPADGPTRPLGELAAATYQLVTWRLNADYAMLAAHLRDLIPELTRCLLAADDRARRQAAGHLTQAWRAADAIAVKLGQFDLSARFIHVMGWAAGLGDDDLLDVAVTYVRGETFLSGGGYGPGLAMLEKASARARRGPPTSARDALRGTLHMRAGLLAARAGLGDEADRHLAEARVLAGGLTSDRVWEGTVFGPASVRIHTASAAVDLDQPDRALRLSGTWTPPLTLPAERRSHFYVDRARACLAVRDHDGSLASLVAAFEIAPQNVRWDPHVNEVLGRLTVGPLSSAARSFATAAAISGLTEAHVK